MSGITRDDWLSAVAEVSAVLPPIDDGAVTINEFARLLGLSRNPAMARMQALVKAGKARLSRKVVLRSDGMRTQVPAYVLIKEIPNDRRASDRVERRAGRDRHAPPRRS